MAKANHSKPSQWFDDGDDMLHPMARYCLDETVALFGMAIEGALSETDDVTRNGKTESKARYTLKQLLDPAFRIQTSMGRGMMEGPIAGTGDGALVVDEVE